jgi:hypothetical protein
MLSFILIVSSTTFFDFMKSSSGRLFAQLLRYTILSFYRILTILYNF